jgi:hypothetical protein
MGALVIEMLKLTILELEDFQKQQTLERESMEVKILTWILTLDLMEM